MFCSPLFLLLQSSALNEFKGIRATWDRGVYPPQAGWQAYRDVQSRLSAGETVMQAPPFSIQYRYWCLEDSWWVVLYFGLAAVVVGHAPCETTDGMKVSLKECVENGMT